MGLEPTTLGTTNQYSNQLSYSHRVFFLMSQKYDFSHSLQIFFSMFLQEIFNSLTFNYLNLKKNFDNR